MDRNEYHKKYYAEHKDTMKKQIMNAKKNRSYAMFLEKLNAGGFTRIPYAKIKRLGLIKQNGIYVKENINNL